MTRLSLALVILVGAACDQQVVVRNTTTVCGDELIAGAEECDDGNTDSTDGCTGRAKLPSAVMEPCAPTLKIQRLPNLRRVTMATPMRTTPA